MTFEGLRVVTSLYLTEPKVVKGWWPCGGGWRKYGARVEQMPQRKAFILGDHTVVVHPAMLPALMAGDLT